MEHFLGCNPFVESLPKLLARNARSIRDARELTEADLVLLGVPAGSAHRGTTSGGQNMKLETLAKWAKALKTPAWALLHPDFRADNPLTIRTEAEIEEEVTRRLREMLKPLGPMIGGLLGTEEPRPDGRSVALPYPDGPATEGKPEVAKGRTTSKTKRRAQT